jgi:hypothetical protein
MSERVRRDEAPGFGYKLKVLEADKPGTCKDCGPSKDCYRILVEVTGGPDDGYQYWAGACHFDLQKPNDK